MLHHCDTILVPMGFIGSTNRVQAVMKEIFQDLIQGVKCYIDNISIFDDNGNKHLKMIDLVLTRLEVHSFTVNPLKCEWVLHKTDWLGHYLMFDGPKPWHKKTGPILALAPPGSLKQLQYIIGFVNFYKDYWKRRAHMMLPFTALTSGLKSNKCFWDGWQKAQLLAMV
jgi:hypothetical protein